MAYSVDGKGFYGEFGGAYIPEILHKCVHDLQDAYLPIIESDGFKQEFRSLLRDYVGRPSPLYFARRMSEKYGCRLYLKREDLNHTGAHKINNAIGQALIARHMGKTHVIAETGAGQHGVATATACALLGMDCKVFMGKTDIERQHVNVERMRMLGAEVCPVTTGNMTLSDACSEAIRYWCCHPSDTFYAVGSTMGPHPYPDLVARMQSVISEELKWQLLEKTGRDHPDCLIACIGGGSNAAGTIYHYADNERVRIILAEAGGCGIHSGRTAALAPDDFLIVEGIHALHPQVLHAFSGQKVQTMFIDVEEEVVQNGSVLFSKRDLRFLRRIVRDYRFRGSSVENTYRLWDNVVKNEEKSLLPYRDRAAYRLNTFIGYECALLSADVRALLPAAQGTPYAKDAARLLRAASELPSVPRCVVPKGSLLEEFVGRPLKRQCICI